MDFLLKYVFSASHVQVGTFQRHYPIRLHPIFWAPAAIADSGFLQLCSLAASRPTAVVQPHLDKLGFRQELLAAARWRGMSKRISFKIFKIIQILKSARCFFINL